MNGIWQLSQRSFRQNSAMLHSHLGRALLCLFFVAIIVYWQLDNFSSAPGLEIFRGQISLTHLFITIMGIFSFSQLIVEEYETGTLDLMQLAGINNLSIVLGKCLPVLCEFGLLIAVQLPFTLLTITLGGVTWPQVFAAYVALFAYLFLVAGVGMFASATFRDSRSAGVLAFVLIVGYLYPVWDDFLGSPGPIGRAINLQQWTERICTSQFDESPWDLSVWIAIAVGGLGIVGAWFQVGRQRRVSVARKQSAAIARPRVTTYPFAWKDYRYVAGGWRGLVIRSILYLGVMIWMILRQEHLGYAFAWSALISLPVAVVDGTWTASRLLADEVKNQTWAPLLLTPHRLRDIVWGKTGGWLYGILPTIVLPYAFIVICILVHPYVDEWEKVAELLIGSTVTGLAVLGYLHLMVMYSIDWHWRAIPITLIICLVAAYTYMETFVPWRWSGSARCVFFLVTGVALCLVLWFLQHRIRKRLDFHAGN